SEVPFLDDLMAVGDGAPSLDRKVELAQALRTSSPEGGRQLDRALFDHLARMSVGLRMAEAAQNELRDMLEQLDSPPWHPALFLRAVPTELGPRAMVLHGGTRRLVAVAESVDLDTMVRGEEVFLGKEFDVVAGLSPYGAPQCGETAFFERGTPDGRCVLRWRD